VTDVNGNTGTLSNSAWVANSVTEISSDGVTKQTVGALSPDGSSFSTTWKQYSGDGVTVQVDYKALTLAPTTQELDIELDIVNTGNTTVDLSAVRPEYWFSADTGSPLEFACDFATVGCSNVNGVFFSGIGTPPTADTEVVLEFGSGAGTLAPGASSGEIEFRIFHSDFSTMTQTNDYSFNAADTTLKPNPNIDSLIVGSELNWGVPPPSSL
jgi:cellulose binding protein with CBM3 domain